MKAAKPFAVIWMTERWNMEGLVHKKMLRPKTNTSQ